MAYSTRSLEPETVGTSRSYWLGVMISSIICPNCNSPRIPRVFVLESTLFKVPTSWATVFISPKPWLTDSNCFETVSKEAFKRFCKVCSSFSSTVWRISSKRFSLDACISLTEFVKLRLMISRRWSERSRFSLKLLWSTSRISFNCVYKSFCRRLSWLFKAKTWSFWAKSSW